MVGRGLGVHLLAAGIVAWAGSARAFPLLRLFLEGDVHRAGSGGAEPFRQLRAEALELERPALLADETETRVTVRLDNQEILDLRAGRFAGTRAGHNRLDLSAVIPLGERAGASTTLFAGVRRERATTHLQDRTQGPLLHLEEDRDLAVIGASTRLPWGLSLGAGVEGGSGSVPGYLVEGHVRPRPGLAAWARHRVVSDGYRVAVPAGAAPKLDTPGLLYELDRRRVETELGAELASERAWLRGALLAERPDDGWAEAGGRPWSWLAIRAGLDRARFAGRDFLLAEGTGTIAAVDLGLVRTRLFAGAEAAVGSGHELRIRYLHGTIGSTSRAREVGTAAARALMDVDLDLGLFLRGGYELESHQVAVGWDGGPSPALRFGLGLQGLRLISHPADLEVRSNTLERALAAERGGDAVVDLLALTGSARWNLGWLRLGAAVGQLVPVSFPDGGGSRGGSGGGGGGGGGGTWLDRLGRAIDRLGRYRGGNLLLLEVSSTF